jgi:hypothetical protein
MCLFGMVVVPWLAVILANDRLPKDRYRLMHRGRPTEEEPAKALSPPDEPRVIDADE